MKNEHDPEVGRLLCWLELAVFGSLADSVRTDVASADSDPTCDGTSRITITATVMAIELSIEFERDR